MQALALWDVGLRRWNEKRAGHKTPGKRPGVAVNRRDLFSIPVSHANLLCRGLKVRNVHAAAGKTVRASNIRIDVTVSGVTDDGPWECGLEFDYANEESFHCRPLRLSEDRNLERMLVPAAAGQVRIAFLPPMSGTGCHGDPSGPGCRQCARRGRTHRRGLAESLPHRSPGWGPLE